jgi:hypothetical protein
VRSQTLHASGKGKTQLRKNDNYPTQADPFNHIDRSNGHVAGTIHYFLHFRDQFIGQLTKTIKFSVMNL